MSYLVTVEGDRGKDQDRGRPQGWRGVSSPENEKESRTRGQTPEPHWEVWAGSHGVTCSQCVVPGPGSIRIPENLLGRHIFWLQSWRLIMPPSVSAPIPSTSKCHLIWKKGLSPLRWADYPGFCGWDQSTITSILIRRQCCKCFTETSSLNFYPLLAPVNAAGS